MSSLSDIIKDPARRRAVVDDGVTVIEAEVASKGGLSGLAIKGAFGMVRKVRPGFVGGALNHMLDDFAGKVDPFWKEALALGGEPEANFRRKGPEVAEALLSITDARARGASGPVRSTYDKLRPQAAEHVKAAMPRLSGLLARHAS
jgi:hypothetical protein